MKSPNIFEVHLEDFHESVIDASHQRPILVDFWADWCGPCLVLAPVLDRLASELNGQLQIAKLEVDEGENMKLAGRYGVRGFPTVILFHQGEELGRFSSARTKQWVQGFLHEYLPNLQMQSVRGVAAENA
jgi:putative thioredoxin